LVDDALFCHRCGKAQRELIAPDEDAAPVQSVAPETVLPPPPAAPLPLNFRNSVAVRIGLLVASVAAVLNTMPLLGFLFIIWSASAGFVSVVLYRRSTGQLLSVRGGAKLGWITGVLTSVIVCTFDAIGLASNSQLVKEIRDQWRSMTNGDPAALSFLDNPYSLAAFIILTLIIMFIMYTGACVAGGALGARITRDERN
jgi:hypothetical protein